VLLAMLRWRFRRWRGGGHQQEERMLADTVDSDEQVKIHQSHKIPTCSHYQREWKISGEREYFLNKCYVRKASSIRLSWSFAVSVTILLSRGLQHFLSWTYVQMVMQYIVSRTLAELRVLYYGLFWYQMCHKMTSSLLLT
jgi:hypothetical protein